MAIMKKIKGVFGGGKGGSGGGAASQGPDLSNLSAFRDTQQSKAKQYRENLSGMKEEENRLARTSARQELSQGLADIRSGMSKRGLLYSGLRQADEAGLGGAVAQGLAARQMQTAADLEQNARGFEDIALQSGLAANEMQNQASADMFEQALSDRERRMKGITSLASAGGGLLGSYMGGKGSAK